MCAQHVYTGPHMCVLFLQDYFVWLSAWSNKDTKGLFVHWLIYVLSPWQDIYSSLTSLEYSDSVANRCSLLDTFWINEMCLAYAYFV